MKITQTAREIEVVVDATTLYLIPRCYNPLQFQRVFRLVVIGKFNDRPKTAKGSSRVASVGHIEGLTDH